MNKLKIVSICKYLWLIIATALILYIINQSVITERNLVYKLDFKESISRDITGWYPESRTLFNEESNKLAILGEPIYLQVYLPIKFDVLTIKGQADFADEDFRLGLKQSDGSWLFKEIGDNNISVFFSLENAQIKRNKIELILSVPDLKATSSISLNNNWQLFLSR